MSNGTTPLPESPSGLALTGVAGMVYFSVAASWYTVSLALSSCALVGHARERAAWITILPVLFLALNTLFSLSSDLEMLVLFLTPALPSDTCRMLSLLGPFLFNGALFWGYMVLYERSNVVTQVMATNNSRQARVGRAMQNFALFLNFGFIPFTIIIVANPEPPLHPWFPDGCLLYFRTWSVIIEAVIVPVITVTYLYLFVAPVLENARNPSIANTPAGRKLRDTAIWNLKVSATVISLDLLIFCFFAAAMILQDPVLSRASIITMSFSLFTNNLAYHSLISRASWIPKPLLSLFAGVVSGTSRSGARSDSKSGGGAGGGGVGSGSPNAAAGRIASSRGMTITAVGTVPGSPVSTRPYSSNSRLVPVP